MQYSDNLKTKSEKKTINKKLTIFFMIFNTLFILLCLLLINFVLKERMISYALEHPLLYEVINDTEDENKLLLFKGNVQNNYVNYNNMIWRIIRVNPSGTITLILDDPINTMFWELDSEFSVLDYLNSDFKNELDLSKLTPNNICDDIITDLNNMTCESVSKNYISLLDVNSYIQTLDNNTTFIQSEKDILWLNNKFNEEEVWHTYSNKISYSKKDSLFQIKPVITLKNDMLYEQGDGSKENPYLISSDSLTIGSIVNLGNENYYVLSTKDSIKLVLKDNLDINYLYTGNYSDTIEYLNNYFYKNLSYKDIILDNEWSFITVDKNTIKNEIVNSKIGLTNLLDFKFDDNLDYYMLSNIDSYVMIYGNPVIYGTVNSKHSLRPTITISKKYLNKFKLIDGIYKLGEL